MKKWQSVKRISGRIALCLGTSLLSSALFLVVGVCMVNKGPSMAARDLLVTTAMETSAAKFLATWFFTDAEIQEIQKNNSVQISTSISDGVLVQPDIQAIAQSTPLEIKEVSGSTYKGKMLIVSDPSRVYVATPAVFGATEGGMRVEEMTARDGAIAGVNGGGFADENGVGNGGKPLGLVISSGVLKSGSLSATYEIIGFDQENKLVVGHMTGRQAMDRGIRDAVCFGPTLIVNGEAAIVNGYGGGLNPRTAIGQRADGAVLILVIDGRQPNSLGANFKDLVQVMSDFGAVNAANLDGGSSSLMVYENEVITYCASLYGSRKIPTAILVKQEAAS